MFKHVHNIFTSIVEPWIEQRDVTRERIYDREDAQFLNSHQLIIYKIPSQRCTHRLPGSDSPNIVWSNGFMTIFAQKTLTINDSVFRLAAMR